MRAIPLFDRVILRWIRDDKTSGGLHVPEVAHRNSPMERGEVLACGPGAVMNGGVTRPMSVKVGDVVWYVKQAAQPFPFQHGDVPKGIAFMISEENIIAILTELDIATDLVSPGGDRLVIEHRGEPS